MAELQNARHEKFAQGIASGLSQRKAYRAAFPNSVKWKDETVDVKASELKKNDKVLVRLEELAQQTTSKAVMTITQRKEWLSELIESATEETKDKLKAVDILNKMDGAYVEKVELGGQINNPMAGLTTDELKKLINDG
jgi:hypothetical protein